MTYTKHLLAIVATASVIAGGVSAQPTVPMPTKDFVQAAAASDQYEILAAQVALTQSQNPHLRAFAQQMIVDHSRTSQALAQAALASGLPPPPKALNDDGAKNLAQLQSLSSAAFDKAYVRQQVLADHSALVVEQDYAQLQAGTK